MNASDLIFAIDPGVKGCGFAAFHMRELVHAEYTGGFGGQVHPLLEASHLIEEHVATIVGAFGKADVLVIEKPQVYHAKHQKGDQRDLIDLAIVVGSIVSACRPHINAALIVTPSEWKGQTPKEITASRVRAALSADEMERVDLPKAQSIQHNVFDAIGIGLWRLGR